MTPTQAAGYLAGASIGFVRRHCGTFATLLALGGLALVLTGTRLTITPTRFDARFGDGSVIGVVMLAISATLWLVFRTRSKG